MVVRVFAATTVGIGESRGGRSRNEDNYLVATGGQVEFVVKGSVLRKPQPGEGALLVVCDGMGGHSHGDVASETAVRAMSQLYGPVRHPCEALVRHVKESHRSIHFKVAERGPVNMGTTLTGAWLHTNGLAWVQVGDSSCYIIREGHIHLLTPRHTRDEFLRRDERTMPETPDHLCQSFIFGSRGLGQDSHLRLEVGLDFGTEPLLRGDRVLLCSDGLDVVPEQEIAQMVSNEPPTKVVEKLIARAMELHSTDNITAVLAVVDQVSLGSMNLESLEDWDDSEETIQF